MRSLLFFILRFHAFILFLLLEWGALYLVVNNNEHQAQTFLSSSNKLIGKMYEWKSKGTRYMTLSQVNDSLANENKHLREQLYTSKFHHDNSQEFIHDSVYQQQFTYIPARVINNNITGYNNYLTLDRGSNSGIGRNMGVVSGKGIVGVVSKVTNNFSGVMSVLHSDIRISARIKDKRHFGTLVWDGRSPQHMRLDAIPKYALIEENDIVETSGYSGIFPEGIMIGKVSGVKVESGSNFQIIEVELFNDLSSIEYIYVVKDLLKTERTALEDALKER